MPKHRGHTDFSEIIIDFFFSRLTGIVKLNISLSDENITWSQYFRQNKSIKLFAPLKRLR